MAHGAGEQCVGAAEDLLSLIFFLGLEQCGGTAEDDIAEQMCLKKRCKNDLIDRMM